MCCSAAPGGQKVTDEITQLSNQSNRSDTENQKLIQLLLAFQHNV